MRRSRTAAWAPVTLAALSGAAGLAHQLLWVRRMVDVLGAGAGTFSSVIAAFFLGLALGSWLAARRPTPRPWRSVAFAELTVGVLAGCLLLAGGWARPWQTHQIFAWLLPVALVSPPALAMGAVIPWMIRAAGQGKAVVIYGSNILGGIAGIGALMAWALPALGLAGASLAAIALNAIAALGALWLDRTARAPEQGAAEPPGRAGKAEYYAVAFASGFLVLASEVILQHQFAQFFVSSYFSSAMVLGLVLAALGIGALGVPLLARLGGRALPAALALAAAASALQPMILVIQRAGMIYLPYQQDALAYALDALRLGLPACTALLLPAGMVFPLLLRGAGARGLEIGRLLAVNGLGGWCGAELAERVIAPLLGLWWSMALVAAGYALCLLLTPSRARWLMIPGLALVIAGSWRIDARLPYAGLAKGESLEAVAVGREGVVGVVRGEPDDWRIIFNNTYTLGGSRAQSNQERQALLPMLLHGGARRVATLGVATGSSLAGATLDPALERAEGIELSPLALRFALEFFAPFNRRVAEDPRVTLTVGDARWVVAQRPGAYDVIVGDLFLPWRTGEGRLFTREHFQNVRAALRPGGIYCQWLPMFQLTRPQFEAIARTFREVFPEMWLIRGDFYAERPILGLVGGIALDRVRWDRAAAACERVRAAGASRDPLTRHVEGAAMCVIGVPPEPPPGPINTLANSWLEWNASRNLIGLREPWFTGVPLANYLAGVEARDASRLPAPLAAARQAGQLALALEIARTAKLAAAPALAARVRSGLPASLREDAGADWSHWPMQHGEGIP